jgi:hypothetical protein
MHILWLRGSGPICRHWEALLFLICLPELKYHRNRVTPGFDSGLQQRDLLNHSRVRLLDFSICACGQAPKLCMDISNLCLDSDSAGSAF